MDPHLEAGLVEYLMQFVTPHKRSLMEGVMEKRTHHLQVVLEDIFQPHNASAVLRSCECFGIQHLHVIEDRYPFSVNRDVAMGASKWVHLHRYQEAGGGNLRHCLSTLRDRGFRIVATSLEEGSTPLHALPVDTPFALCFGTEEDGLSKALMDQADEHLHIPMLGFTQSFNISVSAAICLYELRRRIEETVDNWQLNEAERRQAYLLWLRNSIKRVEVHEREFIRRTQSV